MKYHELPTNERPNAHAKYQNGDENAREEWCYLCMESYPCKDGELEALQNEYARLRTALTLAKAHVEELRDVTAERDRYKAALLAIEAVQYGYTIEEAWGIARAALTNSAGT